MNRRNTALLVAAGGAALLALRARKGRHYSLENRVALITGGSRGLGLVIARELADRGAAIAICARDGNELRRAETDLERRGADVLSVVCDVTDREQVKSMIDRVHERFGRVDVLVNNAGVIQVGPMEHMTLDDYEHAMQVHFWGPLYTSLAVLPEMKKRKDGRIVNISSIGGKLSVPHLLPYSASKFALTGLSEGLHAELAKDGIVVTTVCPGLMRTGSPRNAEFKGQNTAEYTWFAISDSLPITSIAAERAARQIADAIERGEAELILSPQARIAAQFHGLFPGATAEFLGLVTRLLPAPGGVGRRAVKGKDSETSFAPSAFTRLSDRAARRNNEVPPEARSSRDTSREERAARRDAARQQ